MQQALPCFLHLYQFAFFSEKRIIVHVNQLHGHNQVVNPSHTILCNAGFDSLTVDGSVQSSEAT